MASLKTASLKVLSDEPFRASGAEKGPATDGKVMTSGAEKGPATDGKVMTRSPAKDPAVFKPPLPVFSQNDNPRAVHNKENAAGSVDALEDSGYLSLHNSHIDEDDLHGRHSRLSGTGSEYVTPKPSPTKRQDSPHVFTPLDVDRKRNDTYSMSSTPAERHSDPNLPILRFKQAVCEGLAQSFQKNHRYDWSVVARLAEGFHLDRVIGGHMGVDHVDMFSSLLSRNMKRVLAQILALLGDMDLIRCRRVSRTWRQIILDDSAAMKRCQQTEKELRDSQVSQGKASGFTRDSSLSRVVLSSLQRVASSQSSTAPPNSSRKPPSENSLHKTCSRHSQYVQAVSSLKSHESLRKCSRCGSPATHLKEAQRATCTRVSCQFDFCTCCHQSFHGSTPCRELRPRTLASTPTILPGSARSKRNVRRL